MSENPPAARHTAPTRDGGTEERAVPPIRWPHPGRPTLLLIGLWVVGMLVAVFVPALVVPPTARQPDTGPVVVAFLFTFVGALVMLTAGFLLHKRHDEPLAWSFGVVPAFTVVVGGIIMVATKLALG